MKLSLNIKNGTLGGKNFQLTEGFLTIGRGENCSIKFDPLTERIASKKHAFIEAKPDGFYLSDNNSTNGTLLNGNKIQSVKLNSGDTVQFGTGGIEAAVFIETQTNASQETMLRPDMQPPTAFYPQAGYQPQPIIPSPSSFQPVQSSQATQSFQNPVMNLRNSFSGLGAGNIPPVSAAQESKTGKYIGIAVAIFMVVFLSLIVMLLIISNIGILAAIVAAVVAFVPAMFYLLPLIWLDRYDPEPIWLLALAFAWGALVSVIFSYFVNTGVAIIAVQSLDPEAADAISAIISAPIFEEGSKGLGLLLLLIFFRRYFDDILDGIVFAGTIALGFATVENVLYYGAGLIRGGGAGLIFLFILRGILSPFAHVTFTAMTGIGCGIARESHNIFVRILMPILGYAFAVLLHFVWNLMATVLQIGDGGSVFSGSWYYGYFFLQVPFFLLFTCFAFYVMYRQNKILKEMLAIDVARELIPKEHLQKATSAFGGTFWLIEGIFSGKFSARNKYLRALGKLGLSYWHIQRATAAQGQTGSFQQNPILREEVLRWREKV